ncbi:ABC transporter substrate-binding protein [Comamonas koreensis]|uniref:ABC transporter substrate-binding protein n=1 Tax=Comamonas koreensis TaxID=160825 RepID=A0AAW4XXL5_9BURK|nr:ABC transporter substrate-binding protein [Comamonas koreensis]MCD2165808.1 ABC transporter substrate-binding protein [Comamonas koreensis]
MAISHIRALRTPLQPLGLAAALLCLSLGAMAQSGPPVRIGLIVDQSGVYSAITGKGSITAAQMALDEAGGQVLGRKVELLTFDHQSKADSAAAKAREWYDTGVDAIQDVGGSAAALAVLNIAKEKGKVLVMSGPASDRITGDMCGPTVAHWAYNSYSLANAVGKAAAEKFGKQWYFLTADYSGGYDIVKATTQAISTVGGKVIGETRHPLNGSDFSSAVVQAQASKADVIGLANFGNDLVNSIKAAREFGITPESKQKLASLLMYINDVHSVGLRTAQGMLLSEAFYWDMNDETRAFSKKYFAKVNAMPNMSQMGAYSSVKHYLKAVEAAGSTDAKAVMAKMREMPINDVFTKNGRLREDGMMVHDMYLFQVKSPQESKAPWDYYKVISTVPADKAFLPLSESACPLVKK